MRLGGVACALALLIALPSPAQADPQATIKGRIAEGEKRYAEQEYRATIEAFSAVLQDSASTRDQRARAYEYIGLSWLILGKPKKAREAFEDLFSIDPNYQLTDPSRSPKLREFFEEARASFVPGSSAPATVGAELEHAAPTGAVAGRPLEVSAQVTRNAPLVAEVRLFTRRQGMLTFGAHTLRGPGADGRFALVYHPPREVGDYTLEYYLEAVDGKGHVVARVASPQVPIALPVKGTPQPPMVWYKRWYVWAAVGAVIAGVAIGATVAATADKAPDGSLPPGKVSLGLHF